MAKVKASPLLRVVDVMTLVAATALGLGLSRAISPDRLLLSYMPSEDLDAHFPSKLWLLWVVTTLEMRFTYFTPLVATWTVAVLALSLRGPRRAWLRLMRRPGTV